MSDISDCQGLCWVDATSSSPNVFGFADIMTTFAMLVVLYSLVDSRYRFRVSIAPIPLFGLSFFLLGTLGFLSLASDLWFAEGWPVPRSLNHHALFQSVIGCALFVTVMAWIYHAFLTPPIFSHRNAERYFKSVYQLMMRGSEADLEMLAQEIGNSAESLVRLSEEGTRKDEKIEIIMPYGKEHADTALFARNVLLLIGSRKFCKHVISSSPVTAVRLFLAMSDLKKYLRSMCPFAANIGTEAVTSIDSPLQYEEHGFSEGLIGYWRPFTNAIYGDFALVERLGETGRSPLDVDYRIKYPWQAKQLSTYLMALRVTWKSYISSRDHQHSFVLYRAFSDLGENSNELYKLDGTEISAAQTNPYECLRAIVRFLEEAVEDIDELGTQPAFTLRHRTEHPIGATRDIYDLVAEAMFGVISKAAQVTTPSWTAWVIQHNTVWSEFFGYRNSTAHYVVQFKLRRLLYNRLKDFGTQPDFQAAHILGLCLNVLGLQTRSRSIRRRSLHPLHITVLTLVRRHYLSVRQEYPKVAEACLVGDISFDESSNQLVKTYEGVLGKPGSREFLTLLPSESSKSPK